MTQRAGESSELTPWANDRTILTRDPLSLIGTPDTSVRPNDSRGQHLFNVIDVRSWVRLPIV